MPRSRDYALVLAVLGTLAVILTAFWIVMNAP
jgi:hypothetical protein